jgi:hypothetical protein
MRSKPFHAVVVKLVPFLALLASCSGGEVKPVKTDLSEKEKQQVRELNEQRASEWGSTKKK